MMILYRMSKKKMAAALHLLAINNSLCREEIDLARRDLDIATANLNASTLSLEALQSVINKKPVKRSIFGPKRK